MHDVKHALRVLRDNPLFSITVVLTLAVGIAANVAIFSIVNAVILEPVPFDDADTLVQLVSARDRGTSAIASPARYMHWRAETDVLEDVAAYAAVGLNFTGGDMPVRVDAARVTATFFSAFRVPFALGRAFTLEEDSPNGPKAAVLSHEFWASRLGADADVVGRTLSLGGASYTVVGVVAPGFDTREFGGIDVWIPLQLDASTVDHSEYFEVAARLKPGVSLAQARAKIEASAASFHAQFPGAFDPRMGFTVLPFQEAVVGTSAKTMLWTLSGAVAFVLLIACANVANLLLARASGRGRDLAVRSALGAGRWRLVRQLMVESTLLSAIGAALGLVLGFAGIRALLAINTAGLPRLGESGTLLGMDWRIVAFTVGLSLLAALVFGLVPAVAATRTDVSSVLKSAGNRSASAFGESRARSLLVVAQMALAVVLLVGAALLIRTSLALGRVDPGFTVDNVLVLHTPLSEPAQRTTAGIMAVIGSTLERLRTIPNVEAATASCCVPLVPSFGSVFNVIGRDDGGRFTGGGDISISTGDYFETFEIPVLRGRVFDETDDASAPPVVVINRTLAERWWPGGQDPLRDRMQIGGGNALFPTMADEPIRQIIGIVDDVRALRLTDPPRPIMYLPQAQITELFRSFDPETDLAWIVRTRTDPLQSVSVIRESIRQSTGAPVTDVQTMEQILAGSISRQRANATLMAVFGCAALLLAAVGIYGLMAFSVQRRTHEIGIRMALGARPERVLGMVIREGLVLIAIGTTIGIGAALFMADVLASVLFGVAPRDVAVFVAVPLVLVFVAVAAVAIPAHRASRFDPLVALNYE